MKTNLEHAINILTAANMEAGIVLNAQLLATRSMNDVPASRKGNIVKLIIAGDEGVIRGYRLPQVSLSAN